MLHSLQNHKRRFLLFGLIGASGVVVNTLVLYLLVKSGMYILFASMVATETAIITNFIGNNYLTFRDINTSSPLLVRFLKFQVVSVVSLIITVSMLWFLVTTFGESLLLIWNLCAIVAAFFANYILNAKITWNTQVTTHE